VSYNNAGFFDGLINAGGVYLGGIISGMEKKLLETSYSADYKWS